MLLLALAGSASAEGAPDAPQLVIVPAECVRFWSIPDGSGSSVAWDAMLSFAACIQDASVYEVSRADQLEGLVDQLQAALDPSLQFYVVAIQEAPGPVKVRAAYHVGLGQVALITRARASITSPELRPALEPLLEPHAELALLMFTTIERAIVADPSLAPDIVTRNMMLSAHELASALRKGWRRRTGEGAPLLAIDPT